MNRLVNHAARGTTSNGAGAEHTHMHAHTHNKQQRKTFLKNHQSFHMCTCSSSKHIRCFFVSQRILFILPLSPSDLNLSVWLHSRRPWSPSPSEVAALLGTRSKVSVHLLSCQTDSGCSSDTTPACMNWSFKKKKDNIFSQSYGNSYLDWPVDELKQVS